MTNTAGDAGSTAAPATSVAPTPSTPSAPSAPLAPLSPVDAAIFDMDGLMFDTEPLWSQQWAPALAKFGLVEVAGLADAARGTTGDAACRAIRSFYGDGVDAEAVFEEYKRLAAVRFQSPVPKKPGLDRLLDWLAARGIPMAVASSSYEGVVRTNLRNAGVEGRFAQVVSGGMVARSKPAPDIFLEAARRLGSLPARTLVLEDSYAGVRAGVAGGFVTVMVPDLLPPTDEMRAIASAICTDLDEVRVRLEAAESCRPAVRHGSAALPEAVRPETAASA